MLQDARKGVRFKSFPPVLFLQLKRFEYDYDRQSTVKVRTCWRLSGSRSKGSACCLHRCNPCSLAGFLDAVQYSSSAHLCLQVHSMVSLCLKPQHTNLIVHSAVQINDRYEFNDVLDLDVEDGKYLADSADRSVRNL